MVGLPLDSHHREDDHIGWDGLRAHVAATTDRTLTFGKSDNCPHAPSPPGDRRALRGGPVAHD
jgi:hypothetical protein